MRDWRVSPHVGANARSAIRTIVPWWILRDLQEITALVAVWRLREESLDSSASTDAKQRAGSDMRAHPFYASFVDALLSHERLRPIPGDGRAADMGLSA